MLDPKIDNYEAPDESLRDRFERDGFVHVRSVFAPTSLSRYEHFISRQVDRHRSIHSSTTKYQSTYDRAFIQVVNLWKMNECVKEFVFGKKLAAMATHLLGVQGVRLYHDQALYKASGGGITPWHADQYYWPLDSDLTCTAWIPLQDTPLEMGPLSFSIGSHRLNEGRDLPISDKSETVLDALLNETGFPVFNQAYRFGDVSFHKGWTFHRAGANRTPRERKAMTIIYMADEMAVGPCRRKEHLADKAAFLPDRSPGEQADTHMNPLLYP